mmetsp:Transcript_18904/g.28197  ORF Transcript_18904/g.28197 Transcript_18904/m.28197 type:complete len:126 (-) Transcript_18904:366-743(-)
MVRINQLLFTFLTVMMVLGSQHQHYASATNEQTTTTKRYLRSSTLKEENLPFFRFTRYGNTENNGFQTYDTTHRKLPGKFSSAELAGASGIIAFLAIMCFLMCCCGLSPMDILACLCIYEICCDN